MHLFGLDFITLPTLKMRGQTQIKNTLYLTSNFRRVQNVVSVPLGDIAASGFYVPTFQNTLFYLHRRCLHHL
jgi:hypothetical protein